MGIYMGGSASKKKPLHTASNGWQTFDVDDFEYLSSNQPPRTDALWRQIKIDAKAWKPILFWSAGFGNVALAVILDFWPLAVVGIAVMALYLRFLFTVVRSYRFAPLRIGKLVSFEPLPVMPSHAKATVKTQDGRSADVVFPISLVEESVAQSLPVEVLFLDDTRAKVCLTIAVRPARDRVHSR
jgi:hypothetical protein